MPERDDLDQLIDSALGSYAEPRGGIEQRILARVEAARSENPVPGRRWLVWAVIPLAACIVFYIAISAMRSSQRNNVQLPRQEQASVPTSQSLQRELPSSAENPQSHTALASIGARGAKNAKTGVVSPKLDVFPAPQPLTVEEQALVSLAAQPADVRKQVLAKPAGDDAPLQISAIQIPPIPPPDEGKNQGEKP